MRTLRAIRAFGIAALSVSCSSATKQAAKGPDPIAAPTAAIEQDASGPALPILPAREAFTRGWMPLASTGVTEFRKAYPTYDGRGVLIGILDSGIDPGIPGLSTTSTGERKILDLRDFSGEGSVKLEKANPDGDTVVVAGKKLGGFSRVRTTNSAGPWYTGTIAELPLGAMPASDLNGNRTDTDTLPLVVTRASDGWVLFIDSNGNGSLGDEKPVHDYLIAKETFAWSSEKTPPNLTLAANFSDNRGAPSLDLYFDTSAHGSHVAGIAAAHDMYGVKGFDGVAPGAQLLGLKIANDAQGGISTTGSMLRAVDYAINFAHQRRLPLVLNMSFGVGNEAEGKARIDQLIDSVLQAHPDVVFAISAGNDGPGLSTMGFPGSANRAITVGATFPARMLGAVTRANSDPVAYFSARGGELAKPDIATPGLAYSTVPHWNVGDERKGGTSMASPHAAGLSALLVSAVTQKGEKVDARLIKQALMVTARPVPDQTMLDEGTGVPDVRAAMRWLEGSHTVPEVDARPADHGVTAAFRPNGLEAPGDTVQSFVLQRSTGGPESFSLRSNAQWLLAPNSVEMKESSARLDLRYRPEALKNPGVYTGVVSGWTSDTMAGPAFRLVNTIVVPAIGARIETDPQQIPAGGERRLFFRAEAGRPFFVASATTSRSEQAQAFLHEPGGQPYREANGITAGSGDDAALYVVDGRDVVTGLYETITVAPPLQATTSLTVIEQSPLVINGSRDPGGITITLQNADSSSVTTQPFVVLVGAERTETITGHGSTVDPVTFGIPDWAIHATV
ncbi:MAG TPA: S8 family serine peptidase, partial [Gemmatimonadales bacterium]|nr:S8 family serine peptidase [Gemmatimonadales bacterium]